MVRIILLLAGLTAFPPASTDMYLPAIPLLSALWDEPLSRINLALISFFIAFSLAILFFGPISDRFGRKPPLVAGIALYCVATLLCATAQGVDAMIVYRSLQGFGAGSSAAISVAMAKDRFTDEKQRGQVLAYIAMAMAITPMLAPMIGAAVLKLASWPYIFYGQAAFGAIMLLATLAMQETLTQTVNLQVSAVFQRYISLFSNLPFVVYMATCSLLMAPMFAFIASSSTIYQTRMHISATAYSLLFAFNALALMVGSGVYLQLKKKISDNHVIRIALAISLMGTIFLFLLSGSTSIVHFAIPMFCVTFSVGLSRAPTMNLALEQVHEYIGQASSLIVFSNFVVAGVAMAIASQNVANPILLIATIALLAALLAALILALNRFSHRHS